MKTAVVVRGVNTQEPLDFSCYRDTQIPLSEEEMEHIFSEYERLFTSNPTLPYRITKIRPFLEKETDFFCEEDSEGREFFINLFENCDYGEVTLIIVNGLLGLKIDIFKNKTEDATYYKKFLEIHKKIQMFRGVDIKEDVPSLRSILS